MLWVVGGSNWGKLCAAGIKPTKHAKQKAAARRSKNKVPPGKKRARQGQVRTTKR